MDSGVTIIDPNRVDVRGTLSCGQNVTIDVNTVFIGDVTTGRQCHNCTIHHCLQQRHR